MTHLSNGETKLETSTQRTASIQQVILQVFSCPLFLALIICYSLALVLNVSGLFQAPINELLCLVQYIGDIFPIQTGLVKSAFVMQAISLVAGVLMAAALWFIFYNAKTSSSAHYYRIGFTAIQVIQFNFLILFSGIFLLGGLGSVIQLGRAANVIEQQARALLGNAVLAVSLARVLQFGMIIAYILSVYFIFQVIMAFSCMKETACNKFPIKQVSLFVAVTSIILGVCAIVLLAIALHGISILAQELGIRHLVEFNWAMILGNVLSCVSAILFGIYLFVYRKKIGQLD